MVDTSAPQDLTQEQAAMRRRARRRLVGAIAIALSAFVILPMLFDPEPRPLGPDVDINIPAPSSPFEPDAVVAPAAQMGSGEAKAKTAEPTTPAAAPTEPSQAVEAAAAKPVETKAPEVKPAAAEERQPVEKKPVESKPVEKKVVEKKPAEKPAPKDVEKAAPAVKPAPLPKPSGAFASHGFLLQLGAFGSESNAKQLQERVAAAGFKADLNAANGQFRVRVGPYPERDRALDVQNKLKAKGFKSVVIGP
jgi:DedD protein